MSSGPVSPVSYDEEDDLYSFQEYPPQQEVHIYALLITIMFFVLFSCCLLLCWLWEFQSDHFGVSAALFVVVHVIDFLLLMSMLLTNVCEAIRNRI
jgi:hypothetical protein